MRKIVIISVLILNFACISNDKTKIGWVDNNVRYYRGECPLNINPGVHSLTAWKGESISSEAIVWTDKDINKVEAKAGALRCGKNVIYPEDITIGAVKYVISDTKKRFFGPEEERKRHSKDTCFVFDVIDSVPYSNISAGESQPFWVTVNVPRNIAAGEYKGHITIKGDGIRRTKLQINLFVKDRIIPEPAAWNFHLDLWQNPYSVARVEGVELWSEEHFKCLERVMKPLADAGQKVITATMVDKPWNGQTKDAFQSMVAKTLKKDNTWVYDYTVFDSWVEFMMSLGIKEQINCYSLLKWGLKMDYFGVTCKHPCLI